MKNISVLGSTGSIGTQTLEIVRDNDDLKVVALAAGKNADLMEKQAREFLPAIVAMYDENAAKDLKERLKDTNIKVLSGMDGVICAACAKDAEIVVTACVGMIGIRPTIEAIKCKKDIALANKETLVTAGHIVMKLAKDNHVNIYPVDSEHSAIFQSLKSEPHNRINKILLTASGGPFRGKTLEEMKDMHVEDALKHPNWSMGRKITIDSATMVNKGLEVMEAGWLFDVSLDKIQVVIQPQSIIHSMVEYVDGGIIAQLGVPDMKLPIEYALFYPDRRPMNTPKVDFFKLGSISFFEPDLVNFRALKIAYDVGKRGGSLPTVFNAANELAVAKFLDRKIGFTKITDIIEYCVNNSKNIENPTVEQILETEVQTYEMIESMKI